MEESILKPKKYYKNNYLITKNFIDCCKDCGVNNFIFSSTAAVYGNEIKSKKVSENSILKPISMYGFTKKKVENYLKKISDKNFKFFSLRYFNVLGADKYLKYGPIGLDINSFSNNLYKAIMFKKVFKIYGNRHKTFDGTPVRDFIHVDDLANIHFYALKYLIKFKKNQICNCGYGEGYSIKQIVDNLLKNKNVNFEYTFEKKRSGDISYMVADNKKLKQILNYRPKFTDIRKMIISELKWKKKITNN